jgi:hypothetical protein
MLQLQHLSTEQTSGQRTSITLRGIHVPWGNCANELCEWLCWRGAQPGAANNRCHFRRSTARRLLPVREERDRIGSQEVARGVADRRREGACRRNGRGGRQTPMPQHARQSTNTRVKHQRLLAGGVPLDTPLR